MEQLNEIAEEIMSYYGKDNLDYDENIIRHYGTKHHSGRYPWGSGDLPYQHENWFRYKSSADFLEDINRKIAKGWTETPENIKKDFQMSTTDYRLFKRLAKNEQREELRKKVISMKEDDGMSATEIAKKLGLKGESSVRNILQNDSAKSNSNKAQNAADIIESKLNSLTNEKKMLDVGSGVAEELGISQQKLEEAKTILGMKGYNIYKMGIPRVNDKGHQYNTSVLAAPDVSYKDVYDNMGQIESVADYYTEDNGETWFKRKYPQSIDSKRIKINYVEDGGTDKDGVIEIRRGVKDLDLGKSNYAQVRILVDGTHYLKGMAMYSDDIPEGKDIVFNSNKHRGTPALGPKTNTVLKPIETDDPQNPFGAYVKANGQYEYIDEKGNKKLGAINKLKEEGDWNEQSRNLSQQFLAKQDMKLIKQQLKQTYENYDTRYKNIMDVDNSVVRKNLLIDFADECDTAAVDLKAAALPRQRTQVILPLPKIKENEIYAPNFRNGESVCLVRFPHASTAEIPRLIVNNKNQNGKKILGQAADAVGINPAVAERLSGADFDGDTVVVIPENNFVHIKNREPLKGLIGFNAKEEYPYEDGMRVMKKTDVQKEMGMISNLITDMQLKGNPTDDELTRAIKHSQVVIDAKKHLLNYKKSEKELGINELKQKYQRYTDLSGEEHVGGASTLLSRRRQDAQVPETRGSALINRKDKSWYDPSKPEGAYIYKESGRTYIDAKGNEVKAMIDKPLMSTLDDARRISTGTPVEEAYADFANKLKAMANEARKEYAYTPNNSIDKKARLDYADEIADLDKQLKIAKTKSPRERRAQAVANGIIKAKVADYGLNWKEDKDVIKKIGQDAINDARAHYGLAKDFKKVNISPKQWEAIQKHAISDSKVDEILNYVDDKQFNELAMPKSYATVTKAQETKIKAMATRGYTQAEIADAIGKSVSTVQKILDE